MKKCLIIFLILVMFFHFSGCAATFSQDSLTSSLVQSIHVTCESCDSFIRRDYSSPEKIRLILLCIRKLGPDFPAGSDVGTTEGKTLCLTLSDINGRHTVYRLKNNEYLQKNDSPWRKISKENATGFLQLILEMPSDEAPLFFGDTGNNRSGHRVYYPVLWNEAGLKKRLTK